MKETDEITFQSMKQQIDSIYSELIVKESKMIFDESYFNAENNLSSGKESVSES